MKKRVMLTVTKDPYERLQKNVRLAGFPKNWFSTELDKLIQGLDLVVNQIIESRKQGQILTEKQVIENVIRASEKANKMKIKKFEMEREE
jgi:hypothetical protein